MSKVKETVGWFVPFHSTRTIDAQGRVKFANLAFTSGDRPSVLRYGLGALLSMVAWRGDAQAVHANRVKATRKAAKRPSAVPTDV